jgi:hypothetical protein
MCGSTAFLAAHAMDQRSFGGRFLLLCDPMAPAYDPMAPVMDPIEDPIPPAIELDSPVPAPAWPGYAIPGCPDPGLGMPGPYGEGFPKMFFFGLENAAAAKLARLEGDEALSRTSSRNRSRNLRVSCGLGASVPHMRAHVCAQCVGRCQWHSQHGAVLDTFEPLLPNHAALTQRHACMRAAIQRIYTRTHT